MENKFNIEDFCQICFASQVDANTSRASRGHNTIVAWQSHHDQEKKFWCEKNHLTFYLKIVFFSCNLEDNKNSRVDIER
jgi:hypothetical protein